MAEGRPQAGPRVLLARSLGAALGVYRLHPGEPDREAFVAAVERAASAARAALDGGAALLEFSGTRLADADTADEHAERLAGACWTRRVERLVVERPPTVADVAALCDVLSTSADETLDAGGAAALLQARGVTAIRLVEIHPLGVSDVLAVLPETQRTLWRDLDHPVEYARTLVAETEGDDEAAARLLHEVGQLHAALPRAVAARAGLVRRVRLVVEELPPRARSRLTRSIAEHAGAPFPAAYLSNLNDVQLAEVLASLGDPDRAAELAEALGRDAVLATLEAAARERPDDPPTVRIAEDVLRAGREDRERLRAAYPDTLLPAAIAALRDYLHVEDRRAGLERVLDTWAQDVQTSLVAGDTERLELLFDLVGALSAPGRAWTAEPLEQALQRRLEPRALHRLVAEAPDAAVVDRLRAVGDLIAPSILDHLASSPSAGERSAMIALAVDVIGDPAPIVDRLTDNRWFVVRNMCTILERRGDPTVGQPLRAAARHRDPRVRTAAVRALRACLGPRATAELRAAAGDEDGEVRQAALRALAGLPGGPDAIAEVASSADDRRVQDDAVSALAGAPGRDAATALRALTTRPAPRRLRRLARRALGARA